VRDIITYKRGDATYVLFSKVDGPMEEYKLAE
jgi:hypothetical protein